MSASVCILASFCTLLLRVKALPTNSIIPAIISSSACFELIFHTAAIFLVCSQLLNSTWPSVHTRIKVIKPNQPIALFRPRPETEWNLFFSCLDKSAWLPFNSPHYSLFQPPQYYRHSTVMKTSHVHAPVYWSLQKTNPITSHTGVRSNFFLNKSLYQPKPIPLFHYTP